MSRVERNRALYNETSDNKPEGESGGQPGSERGGLPGGEKSRQLVGERSRRQSGRKGSVLAGRILHTIGVVLMAVVLAACFSLLIPKFAGYDAYVVVSGSMEPSIPVGSIVYSHKTEPSELQAGDVIVFVDPARGTTPITHRVVTNDTAKGIITTKGDANDGVDIDPVIYDNVVGKVTAHIPRIGYTAAMFTSVMGKITAALIMIEAWLLMEIGRRLRAKGRAKSSVES